MIERYSRQEMSSIWSEDNRFSQLLKIEICVLQAQAKLGNVPQKAVEEIRKQARFNLARIKKIEEKTQHDVIAFISDVSGSIGKNARYFHLGLTSSDILDTALALQCRQACDVLLGGIKGLKDALRKKVKKYKNTPCIGRTHGVHAEPMTFGLKLASWYTEILRSQELLERTKECISYAKISGAVGTYSNIDPFVEKYVAKELGLKVEPVSTQIIPRDRHAIFLARIAIVASSLERFALEIRHLQRTEVLEVEEPFGKGQKGSSAMPHKRNPVICERICGLARVLRGNALVGMENIALWHERDISHSSAERIILPDSAIALDYMLYKMTAVIDGLAVYPENMLKNLVKTGGLIFSQRVLTALMDKGIKRMVAYEIVQRNALKSWQDGSSFQDNLIRDKELSKALNVKELKECFNLNYYLRNIDKIFRRIKL